jgi:hypothetical protein
MIKRLFFFTVLFISLLTSCVAKKTVTEYKEVVKMDSIYITNDRYITKQVNDTILIEQPCDTLGNLKDFDRQIHSGGVKVSLKSVNGNIKATVDIDSIVASKITEFKQNYKSEVQIKEIEIVKFRTPFWVWGIIIFEGLIILLLFKFK